MKYLSVDVGTTCCKCQLFDESGAILEYYAREYALKSSDGERYADLDAIVAGVFSLINSVKDRRGVSSICFSCFGETFVSLDKNGKPLCDPMLYTDRRGQEEAEEIASLIGAERYAAITGVTPHAMYSVSKLLWMKKHLPGVYSKIDRIMLIGDYLGYLLTGQRVIDYSLAARTGLFDVNNLRFSEELCSALGIGRDLFSAPARAGTAVGKVRGIEGLENCVLVLGAHDQVCAALGAGLTKPGQAVDGLGTVECITVVYSEKDVKKEAASAGICRVPYALPGLFCSYIVTYSCASVINWFKNELLHGYRGEESSVYAYLEKRMSDAPSDLFLLPLFSGSFIPYNDPTAKGALIGLTAQTTDAEIYRAIMEGLAFEMRFECSVAEKYGIRVERAIAAGGGANSGKWLQIKADIQKIPYATLRSSEGGLCGCAVLQHAAVSGASFEESSEVFVRTDRTFLPRAGDLYEEKYKKYTKLYHCLKEFF